MEITEIISNKFSNPKQIFKRTCLPNFIGSLFQQFSLFRVLTNHEQLLERAKRHVHTNICCVYAGGEAAACAGGRDALKPQTQCFFFFFF